MVKEDIEKLTEQRILEALKFDRLETPEDERNFQAKLMQGKLGMTYTRDREIMKRIQNGQALRVITLVSSDSEERKEYIKASMPHMLIEK